MRIVTTPVSASPARIAAWMGDAPRQRGSNEAWTLTQPRRGSARISGGRIRPYATTAIASGRASRRRATRPAFAFNVSGFSVGSPRDAASAPTAEGRSSACRPTGRSGCVTTSGTSAPASSSAWRDAAANSGVPKNAVRGNRSAVTVESRGSGERLLRRARVVAREGRGGRRRFRGRVPQLPEPPGGDRADRGEEDQREAVDDSENGPDPRP